jgi:hypothetical protein
MPHLIAHLPHFPHKHTAPNQHTAMPVVLTEQPVLFSTAAATGVPHATPHHYSGRSLANAVGHIPHHLPPPHPHPWRQDAIHTYFEMTRMSRQVDHL